MGSGEDQSPGTKGWLTSLLRILCREEGRLPGGLLADLMIVAALSSAPGHESLADHARARRARVHDSRAKSVRG